jgi:hypothetical protein
MSLETLGRIDGLPTYNGADNPNVFDLLVADRVRDVGEDDEVGELASLDRFLV